MERKRNSAATPQLQESKETFEGTILADAEERAAGGKKQQYGRG